MKLDCAEAHLAWFGSTTIRPAEICSVDRFGRMQTEIKISGAPWWLNYVNYGTWEQEKQPRLDAIKLIRNADPSRIDKDIERHKKAVQETPSEEQGRAEHQAKLEKAELRTKTTFQNYSDAVCMQVTAPDPAVVAKAANAYMNAETNRNILRNQKRLSPVYEPLEQREAHLDAALQLKTRVLRAASLLDIVWSCKAATFNHVRPHYTWNRTDETAAEEHVYYSWWTA